MLDAHPLVAEAVPTARIEIAPNADPDKRSYRVNFDKIAYSPTDARPIRTTPNLPVGVAQLMGQSQNFFHTSHV